MADRIYTVQPGDSLSKIAGQALGDPQRYAELAFINSISDPNVIFPGQKLLIPDDEPLAITITGQAAPTREARFSFNPATVVLLVIGAALLFWGNENAR